MTPLLPASIPSAKLNVIPCSCVRSHRAAPLERFVELWSERNCLSNQASSCCTQLRRATLSVTPEWRPAILPALNAKSAGIP